MAYLVFCTFDLKQGTASDYENAYADLASIGLSRVHKSDQGSDVVIPTTAAMGFFNGTGAVSIRTNICDRIEQAFRARRLKSEIFVVVGGDWAWGARTT